MAIVDRIDTALKQALKAGDKLKLTVLRGLKSDIKYRQIELHADLSDEQVLEVLSSAAKRRRESIEQFQNGGRPELAQKEQSELEMISEYLPQQLSEDDLRRLIAEAISESGAQSPKDIGKVMKALMPKIKGRADGKVVNKLVSESLAK